MSYGSIWRITPEFRNQATSIKKSKYYLLSMILKFKFLNFIFVIYILLILISCRETVTKSELGSAKTEENDDKIIIIDQKLNEWDITAAVEIYAMEPRIFSCRYVSS